MTIRTDKEALIALAEVEKRFLRMKSDSSGIPSGYEIRHCMEAIATIFAHLRTQPTLEGDR